MNVSVIITSSHEPQTIGRALKAILDQDSSQINKFDAGAIKEILVVAPDEKTLKAAATLSEQSESKGKVKFLKDPGKGKPLALSLAFQKSAGDILVLTDGDVYVSPDALSHLLAPFSDSQAGGVSGRPIPTNRRDTMLGFWSHFLTDSAHQLRLAHLQKDRFIELSGYLLAIRKNLARSIPPEILADDLFLSHLVQKSGFKTAYAPQAEVFVKYPTNLADWFKQKKRTSLEYWQNQYSSGQKMRTPFKEVLYGLKFFLTYPKNPKEFFWLVLLFKARALLWLQIFFLKLTRSKKNLWVKVESTK